MTTQTRSTMSTRARTTKILERHEKFTIPRRVRFREVPSLLTMTDAKSPRVLKKEEVEKGNYGTVVELLYVPIHDEEAESKSNASWNTSCSL